MPLLTAMHQKVVLITNSRDRPTASLNVLGVAASVNPNMLGTLSRPLELPLVGPARRLGGYVGILLRVRRF